MEIKFLKLHPDAKLPEKAYENDFCYDVTATSREEIAPNVYKYGLGFALQFSDNYNIPYIEDFEYNVCQQMRNHISDEEVLSSWKKGEEFKNLKTSSTSRVCKTFDFDPSLINISIDVRPRSSIYKTGLMLVNSPGTIDFGYTNECCVLMRHVDKDAPIYEIGDKVAQIKIGFTVPMNFHIVSELNETERGKKGFGSSGK